jgi:hypothetical protein
MQIEKSSIDSMTKVEAKMIHLLIYKVRLNILDSKINDSGWKC